MSDKKKQEFEAKVQAVKDAADLYAECRINGDDWFARGLDDQLRNAVETLLNFGREYPELPAVIYD